MPDGMYVAAVLTFFLVPGIAAQVPDVPETVPGVALLPEQAHVTLSDEGLVIHWAVSAVPYPTNDVPYVAYQVDGGPEQVSLAHLVGVVAPGTPSPLHAVPWSTYVYATEILVAPGSEVTYSAGSDDRGTTGPFTAHVPPGPADSLRFAAFGDIGVDCTTPLGTPMPNVDVGDATVDPDCVAFQIRDLAIGQDPDLVIIPGDLAYDNTRAGWDAFMRYMEPLQAMQFLLDKMRGTKGNDEFLITMNS